MGLTVASMIAGLVLLLVALVAKWVWFVRLRRRARRDAAIKVDEDHARAIRELAAADYAEFVRRQRSRIH